VTAAELELEHDNLRPALASALETDPVSAARIAASLLRFLAELVVSGLP
jgi:hypothetical protein